jgi:histidinol-phosphatase (PHP family)
MKTYNKRITLMVQYELLKEVLKLIISKGKGIEINTSGLRQAPMETMPGVDVLKFYHELGGEILTIGSDAHRAEDVAEGIDTAIENAKQAGFKHLTIFNNRKPEWVPII